MNEAPLLPPLYKKLVIAAAAILGVLIVKWTGLDGGLIDALMDGVTEVVVGDEPVPQPQLPEGVEPAD